MSGWLTDRIAQLPPQFREGARRICDPLSRSADSNRLLQLLSHDLSPEELLATVFPLDSSFIAVGNAGTGKTTALARRAAFLLLISVPQERILCVARSRSDGERFVTQVRAVLNSLLHPDLSQPTHAWLRHLAAETSVTTATGRALANEFLRRQAVERDPDRRVVRFSKSRLVSDRERVTILEGILRNRDLPLSVGEASAFIARAKHRLAAPEAAHHLGCSAEVAVYRAYLEFTASNGIHDEDDPIVWAAEALAENRDRKRHFARIYRAVFIDRYEDTSFAEHLLLHGLLGEIPTAAAADPASSIYSWCGADAENVSRFGVDFRAAYMRMTRPRRTIPSETRLVALRDEPAETEFITNAVSNRIDSGMAAGAIAVLARSRHRLRSIATRLESIGVPTSGVKARSEAFDFSLVLITYFGTEILTATRKSPADEAVLRIYLTDISDTLAKIHGSRNPDGFAQRIRLLRDFFTSAFGRDPRNLPAGLAERAGLEVDDEFRDLADALTRGWAAGISPADLVAGSLEAIGERDYGALRTEASVALLSFHAAQGREFEAVFLIGMEDDTFPARNALEQEMIAGEEALFRVATTRATRELTVTRTLVDPNGSRRSASRFLAGLGLQELNA